MARKDKRGNGEGSIFELADGTWRGFITLGFDSRGKQVKKWRRGKTRRDVANKLNQIAAESGSRLVTAPQQVTVGQWLTRHADLLAAQVKPKTALIHQTYLKKIVDELGHIYLHKLEPFHVTSFYAKLARSRLGTSVRQHLHHFFKAALHQAARQGLIDRNPLDVIDRPRGDSPRESTVWNREEAKAFLDVASEHRLYPLFYCLLNFGPRIGEALGLQWPDLSEDSIYIQRTLTNVNSVLSTGTPKTKRSYRTVYLSADLISVLVRRKEEQELERELSKQWTQNDYIFSSSVGTLMNPSNVRREFRKLIALAGVPVIRIHDLRHTHITLARDAGIDAEVVANRVGQDVKVTMQIYSHVTDARKRKAAMGMEELLNEERHLRGTYRGPTEPNADTSEPN